MTNKTHSGLLVVALAAGLAGCDDGRRLGPAGPTVTPTTTPTPAPTVTYVLSGVVFEMTADRRVPIEGVEVYCDSCGSPVGHTFVSTDADGFYTLAWTANGVHPLFVTKAGYRLFDPAGALRDQIDAIVSGDTRFDIQLVR